MVDVWLMYSLASLRTFKTGDVKFVWRVLPHKLGLKVTNLDLLGVIKGKDLFGKLVDDDVVRVCLLLALEVIFMGKKLVDEVPDTLIRLVENLKVWNDIRWVEYIWRHLYDHILNLVNKNKWEHLPGLSKSRNYVPTYTLSGFVWSFKDSTVNLDLTPTKSEHQCDWYKFFREYYTAYVPRSAPTRYPDMFDDYLKKLSASRKRGKLDTRDLPIIRRCDTTSVEEIKVKDCVISQLNSRVYKLVTIIKDKSCMAVFFNISSEYLDALDEEFHELYQTSFIDNRPAENGLDYDDNLVKAPDRVHLTDVFDIFLGRQGLLRASLHGAKMLVLTEGMLDPKTLIGLWLVVTLCSFFFKTRSYWGMLMVAGIKLRRAMLTRVFISYFMSEQESERILIGFGVRPDSLDPTIVKISYPYSGLGSWFVFVYTVSTDRWIRLQNFPSVALRIKHAGQAVIDNVHTRNSNCLACCLLLYFPIRQQSGSFSKLPCSVNTPYSSKLVGFNNNEEPIIEVDDTGYQMDTNLQVYNLTQGEFQNVGVDAIHVSFFVGPMKESLILVMLPEVLMQGKIFDQKGIDHTTYNITFANAMKVPKQAGVFGDCGIWPDNPIVDHGREILERLTGTDMRNAMKIVAARHELHRSMAEKVEMINNHTQM
nr:phospholipase-like protein [Tanacetum cinerariifolium]